MEKITYKQEMGIDIKGVHYRSFSSACSALGIPRQQSLRAFKKQALFLQEHVDDFFDSLVAHYQSEEYKNNKEVWSKFKDGRVAPMQYKEGTFRSKNALAAHLKTRANPFKVRLKFLEDGGVKITDEIIELCTRPFHKSNEAIELDMSATLAKLNSNFNTSVTASMVSKWDGMEDHCFKMPLTSLAILLNIEYETLKRQVYDLKFNSKPDLTDVLNVISTLKPSGEILEVNDRKYESLFALMLESSYKMNIKSVSGVLAAYKARIA